MGTYGVGKSYVTITANGVDEIVAYGSKGEGNQGGFGGEIGGYFNVYAGETLKIVAGGEFNVSGDSLGGSGGGGSFIYAKMPGASGYTLLLAAGGGGGHGGGGVTNYSLYNHKYTPGGAGKPGGVLLGGSGNGGAAGANAAGYGGGGGGGVKGNGYSNGGPGPNGGRAGVGGSIGSNPYGGGYAGGGGGGNGGGAYHPGAGGGGGGGGGGYTGGAGGAGGGATQGGAGGYGGTSYDAGTPTIDVGGENGGNGFVLITAFAVCYVTGTLIRTARGDVPVEALEVGDLAVTASSERRPIRWIGQRPVDCRVHPDKQALWPIRVAAHAFAPNRPERDLWVSPRHSLCVDVLGEVLIPACALLNGATVTQPEAREVTYWHVELDSHDILIANGQPAESYLDDGNRSFFEFGAATRLRPAPDKTPANTAFCRPRIEDGAIVAAVRTRMETQAYALGWRRDETLVGWLELDGRRLAPARCGDTLEFEVPGPGRDLRLVSPAVRPREAGLSADERPLGLCLAGLAILGCAGERLVALDDPLLAEGFHELEPGGWRWTDGAARLPAEFFADVAGPFRLRVRLAGGPVPRWTLPVMDDEAQAA
jgi:hypothetical protein